MLPITGDGTAAALSCYTPIGSFIDGKDVCNVSMDARDTKQSSYKSPLTDSCTAQRHVADGFVRVDGQ